MRKIFLTLVCIILLSSFVVAESGSQVTILINPLSQSIYNIGDSIKIPITISSYQKVQGELKTELVCDGKLMKSYNEDIEVSPSNTRSILRTINLIKGTIGFSKGSCLVKFTINNDYETTEDFKISDLLTITLKSGEGEYKPEDKIVVQGEVVKENGELVNGFIEVEIFSNNNSQNTYMETVNNGFFTIDLSLPPETGAGPYLISLNAYEKDFAGEVTNKGFLDYTITIVQVPKSLEVLFENSEIEPGTNLRVKAILHDQIGKNIDGTTAIITIKNSQDKILHQEEKATNEFLDFPIEYKEKPDNWTVYAISTQLTGEAKATIKEKKEVTYELSNKTLIIKNTGNVLYNDTVFIKIGEEIKEIKTYLEIDESKKYTLSAPEGEYDIEAVKEEGSEKIGRVGLTGNSISVEEAKSVVSKIFNPFVWIFITAICGFVAFMFFKKGYRRSFIGYIQSKKDSWKNSKKKDLNNRINSKESIKTQGNATLSLSIKGDKQEANVVCLKIKNLKEVESKKGKANSVLQEIINAAKNKKATVYESGEYFFFILAPIITKTFKNEMASIDIARSTQNFLLNYNKNAEKKIEFGISINYGTIIAKKEGDELKFMSLKTFVPNAKKIATMSDQEVLLTGEMNDRLIGVGGVRTDKIIRHGVKFYIIKELRDVSGDKTFMSGFMKRMEQESKKKD